VRAQTRTTVRVGTDPYDSFSEAYYAQDQGLFQKAGLDVHVLTFMNGAAISDAVAGGAVDVGISNPVSLANAIAHGVPFTLIAGGGMYTSTAPTTILAVAKNSPLRTIADLDGKTVATSGVKNTDEAAMHGWLAQHKAENVKIRFVEMPFSVMGATLARGAVDAAVLAEPSLQDAIERDQIRIFGKPFDAIAPQFLIGAWFSTQTFVRANPQFIRDFVATIYAAGRWANGNHAGSADILAKYSKLAPETTRRMTRVVYADSVRPGLLQPLLDLAVKYGIVDRAVAATEMIAKL
jgi:NitT/TauT family transport system substrate-binding protein